MLAGLGMFRKVSSMNPDALHPASRPKRDLGRKRAEGLGLRVRPKRNLKTHRGALVGFVKGAETGI